MNQEYWKYSRILRKDLFRWCDYWQLPPLEARFLLTRGLKDKNEKEIFFSESEEKFSPPFLWDDLEKSSLRIWKALQAGERVCIYGDYDVDGISGTAILLEAIKRLGFSAEYYIPDRQEEGYGLNQEALQALMDSGINLLVTVDCGTTSVDLIEEAQKKIDVIVTDHHLPGRELPKAYGLINPQCIENFSADPLAGAGVAFKLAQGIYSSAGRSVSHIQDLLGWAALAAVADMVPLQGENRLIVKKGLEELRRSNHVGLKALMDAAGIVQPDLSEKDLGFSLGPRLNASGRLQTARLGVELFLCSDSARAQEIAMELNEINRERQQIEKEILEEACRMVEKYTELPSGIVLYQANWHPGVIGIVASRIARLYWRPTLLLCGSEEEIKGSGRSIPAVDLYETLVKCSDYLGHFGGHRQAAGLSLAYENLEMFCSAFQKEVENQTTKEDLVRQRSFDGMLTLNEIDDSLVERLSQLAPFGIGNQAPRFVFPYLEVLSAKAFGKDRKHLKIEIKSGNQNGEAIIWNRGSEFSAYTPGMKISGIGEFRKNTWNQKEKFDLFFEEISVGEELPLLTETFDEKNPHSLVGVFPTQRDIFKKFFELLIRLSKESPLLSAEQIGALWKEGNPEASWQEVDYLLSVFEELGIISNQNEYLVSISTGAPKTSLEKSQSYQKELEKAREQ